MNNVRSKNLENELTDEFKIEYIKLLNIFNKAKVFTELQTGKYPTNETLQICEDYKNELAIAYFKERLGFFGEALQIYQKRFKKLIKALVKGGRYNDEFKRAPLLRRLKREAGLAINMCKDAENHEELLFNLFDYLLKLTDSYSKYEVEEWTDFLEAILKTMMDHIKLDYFVNRVRSESTNFFLNEKLVRKVINFFREHIKMVTSALEITQLDTLKKDFALFADELKGNRKLVDVKQYSKESSGH